MSKHTPPPNPEQVTHLGSAVVAPQDTGTIEEAFQFETPAGRFVRRTTTASEVQHTELFQIMEDGTEELLASECVEFAALAASRPEQRRAAFRLIEGGQTGTRLPPPSTPSDVVVPPFGSGLAGAA